MTEKIIIKIHIILQTSPSKTNLKVRKNELQILLNHKILMTLFETVLGDSDNYFSIFNTAIIFIYMSKLVDELKQDIQYQHGMNACLNCGICTAVCPAAEVYDYSPREVMNICQTEDEEWLIDLLKSDKIWFCGQCYSCKPRCPRGNSTADVILALRRLSVRHGYFAESEKGRQQLFAKRVFGENMLKRGYTLTAENITPEHFPELGENWEYYFEHMKEMREWWDVPMDKENSAGSHRIIPEKDMDELRKIYKATGAMELMEAVEKGMEKKLGSKKEVEKFWDNWVETADSRNYEMKH